MARNLAPLGTGLLARAQRHIGRRKVGNEEAYDEVDPPRAKRKASRKEGVEKIAKKTKKKGDEELKQLRKAQEDRRRKLLTEKKRRIAEKSTES